MGIAGLAVGCAAACSTDSTEIEPGVPDSTEVPTDDNEALSDAVAPNCDPPPEGEATPALRLQPIASGLVEPTFVTPLPGRSSTLLVVEQQGLVRRIEEGQSAPSELPVWLDLSDRVNSSGNERGLLGLAFHPSYRQNGLFYVYYTSLPRPDRSISSGASVVAEFRHEAGSREAVDVSNERVVLSVEQPYGNHNGGMLAFSPMDSMLYIGLGDGGSGGDPEGHGQNLQSLLGKILRLDVNDAEGDAGYGIPPGNLSAPDARPEIWSYGLRNPWRFSFDACNGDMYIGDVGQTTREEIDYEPAGAGGRNYGWNIREGSLCYGVDDGCATEGFVDPVVDYPRSFGISVTGGYVYRGRALPGLRGRYLYADYRSGRFGSFRIRNGEATEVEELTNNLNPDDVDAITSFGEDARGEMLVLSRDGVLYRIAAL